KRALYSALQIAQDHEAVPWIREQLDSIPSSLHDPGLVFRELKVNIVGNPNLRRPQTEADEAALAHFERGREHAIIQLPVGCGKTGAISLLPFGISSGRMLVVAPNLEIRRNLLDNLDYTNSKSFLRNRSVLSNGRGPTCAVLDGEANLHDCDNSAIVVTN